MTFAFDEQFAMFDITPVENQFILEYLPGAKGDYVKVYLYGLLCCYHPKSGKDLSDLCRELSMNEEEILSAFRYWERRGLIRRIQDRPPIWQYVNIKQLSLSGEINVPDPDYVRFSRELENCFDGIRDFHGSETAACYEWKEGLGLPDEVILMLLMHMKNTRGKSFKIRDAEKVALLLAEEKAYTIEEAEHVLARDQAVNAGFKKVLRKLGMRFNPSDANLSLYRKWTQDWHFTQDAIEAACDSMETSSPSLALLDTILEKTYRATGGSNRILVREDLEESEQRRKGLKEIMNETGLRGAPTPSQQKLYVQMRELYPQSIILLAAKECAAKQLDLNSVLKLLQSWKDRGFTRDEEIEEHISAFHDKEEFLKSLRKKWSVHGNEPGQKAFELLEKWENELGFSREMILLSADLAFEAKKPIAYMDKTLCHWAEEGIRTPDDIRLEQERNSGPNEIKHRKNNQRTVSAQKYTQRDYTGEQDDAMRRMISMDGGDSIA